MADPKKPLEEVSAEDAQAMFANAAKALGGDRGRQAGFRRVSIPVSEPVRPEPLAKEPPKVEEPVVISPVEPPKAEAPAPEKNQSKRKAWYLRKRKEEEEASVPISKEKLAARQESRLAAAAAEPAVEEEEDVRIYHAPEPEEEPEERYDFAATTVIPSAVTFDYGEEDYDDYADDEVTDEMIEEEMAFSALAAALDRHADVYGDPRKSRKNRYHDYGFGMGITFDGPSYYDEDDDI